MANNLTRLKIIIRGTKTDQYLEGQLEGMTGHVLAAQENPTAYEQTARVKLDDGSEHSLPSRYIMPQSPKYGDEVLILASGKYRGQTLIVRESEDTKVVVSSKENPADIDTVVKSLVVPLLDHTP